MQRRAFQQTASRPAPILPRLPNDVSFRSIIATRRGRTKYGYYINVEQAVTEQVGLFGRLSEKSGV